MGLSPQARMLVGGAIGPQKTPQRSEMHGAAIGCQRRLQDCLS
jgi:hypothetical protein